MGAEGGVPARDGAVEGGEEEGGLGVVGEKHPGGCGGADGAGRLTDRSADVGEGGNDDFAGNCRCGLYDVVEAGSFGADPPGSAGGHGPGLMKLVSVMVAGTEPSETRLVTL